MDWKFRKLLFIFSFLTSCQSVSQSNQDIYIDLAKKEVFSFARDVGQSDGLYLFGQTGCYLEGIGNLILTFMSPTSPSIEEARLQFYDVSTSFLNSINNNESLREYLINYPFTIDNLTMYILYAQQASGSVSVVTMGEAFDCLNRPNIVYYYGYDSKNSPIKIYEEKYEEGLKIVRDYSNKNPDYLLHPRPLPLPLKYLDKKKWIEEALRARRDSFADNFVTPNVKKDKDEFN